MNRVQTIPVRDIIYLTIHVIFMKVLYNNSLSHHILRKYYGYRKYNLLQVVRNFTKVEDSIRTDDKVMLKNCVLYQHKTDNYRYLYYLSKVEICL